MFDLSYTKEIYENVSLFPKSDFQAYCFPRNANKNLIYPPQFNLTLRAEK